MKTKRNSIAPAVLSSTFPNAEVGFAALSLTSNSDGWYQLLPAGHFKAVDGRPFDVAGGQWFLDEHTAQSLITELKARVNPTVIDYEHQTLLADKNGQPAPASGWIKDAQWRDSGLWIKADWTGRAAEYIKGGEYCYLSAVFPYDKQTGKPLSLHSAALVNRPGLDGLNAVALRSLHFSTPAQEDSLMDRKKLIEQLGLADDATDNQIFAALKQLQDDKLASDQALAALKSTPQTTIVDPAKYVPIQVVMDLQTQVAALSAQVQTGGLDKLIADALDTGKIVPSMESWARDWGQKDMAALKGFLDKAAPIAALKGMQAGTEAPPLTTGSHGLTDTEKVAAELTGRTPEEYAALKAKAL